MQQAQLLQAAGPGRDHGQDLGQLQPGQATLQGEEPQVELETNLREVLQSHVYRVFECDNASKW